MILRMSSDACVREVRGMCGGGAMRVTAAARIRPVRCVAATTLHFRPLILCE